MIKLNTVKVSFLARDRERTVPMYITDICQNDHNEKSYKKKFTRAWSRAKNKTLTEKRYFERF
jgi:hypothetical protein